MQLTKTIHTEGKFEVTIITLSSSEIPKEFNNYRMVQLSDLHYGACTKAEVIEKTVKITNDLKPDLVLLTGDYVQFSATGMRHILATKVNPKIFGWIKYRRQVRKLCEELREILVALNPTDGMMAIYGNHDYNEGLGTITRQLPKEIRWLLNSEQALNKNGKKLLVSGLDDYKYGLPDLRSVATSAKSDDYFLKILLAHNPDFFSHPLSNNLKEFNLILCGHTHGGQICLPNRKPIISRTKQRKYISGTYNFDKSHVHVSRGIGCGGLPFRINCPSEIVLIQLQSNK